MSDENGVQAVERAIDILESVAAEQNGRNLTEISSDTGLHKSTAYRIIMTLMRRGYLVKGDNGNYKIGHKMIETTSYYISELDLHTEARPYIAEINSYLGLDGYLGILDGDTVVYIEKISGAGVRKLFSQVGMRIPAYCSSLGKCLLSGLSGEELEKVMKDCSFIRFTPTTITDMKSLHRELSDVRARGWAIDDEEYERGHRCIGAPIYDYKGDIVAAISASGDKHVLGDDRIDEIAEYVKKAAAEISEKMGYVE